MKFKQKEKIIGDAILYTGENYTEIIKFLFSDDKVTSVSVLNNNGFCDMNISFIYDDNHGALLDVSVNEYIIRSSYNINCLPYDKLYTVKFNDLYELVENGK